MPMSLRSTPPSRPYPGPSQAINPVRKMISPEDKIPVGKEPHKVGMKFESAYDEARKTVEHFNRWIEGKPFSSPSLRDFQEEPVSVIKMSMNDWIKLSDDLNIFETDQKSSIFFLAKDAFANVLLDIPSIPMTRPPQLLLSNTRLALSTNQLYKSSQKDLLLLSQIFRHPFEGNLSL